MTITLLTGAGSFGDPWHDFAGIGAALAPVLALRGTLEASEHVEATLTALPESRPDLLVICLGDDGESRELPSSAAREGLSRYLHDGGRMLALHASATAFPHWPQWRGLLGGRWVPETSFHPPFGPAIVRVSGGGTLEVVDELYTDLLVEPGVDVLAWHEREGQKHPLSWTHRVGSGVVVFDALGHAPESYHDSSRLSLLASELDLLLSAG